jgi:hypothetical protein
MFKHSDMSCNGIIELFEVYNTCKNLNLKMLMDEREDLFSEANQNKYVAIDQFEFMVLMQYSGSPRHRVMLPINNFTPICILVLAIILE